MTSRTAYSDIARRRLFRQALRRWTLGYDLLAITWKRRSRVMPRDNSSVNCGVDEVGNACLSDAFSQLFACIEALDCHPMNHKVFHDLGYPVVVVPLDEAKKVHTCLLDWGYNFFPLDSFVGPCKYRNTTQKNLPTTAARLPSIDTHTTSKGGKPITSTSTSSDTFVLPVSATATPSPTSGARKLKASVTALVVSLMCAALL